EDCTSAPVSAALAFATAMGGAGGVYALDLLTRAFVGERARVRSRGSVVVSADDDTEIDIDAGVTGVSGVSSTGGSAGAAVVQKVTEAFVGEGAQVTALGIAPGITAPTGDFAISFVPDGSAPGEVKVPGIVGNPSGVLGFVFNNPIQNFVDPTP